MRFMLALLPSIMVSLILLAAVCRVVVSVDPMAVDRHIDRYYMKKVIFPFISRMARKDNEDILEIGMEAGNVNDCIKIDVPCENFYINDIAFNFTMPPDRGSFLYGPFASLANNPKNIHKFRLIFDFGVLGFRTFVWKDEDILAHIMAYSKLLKPGGTLLLKWDMGFRVAEHWKYWKMVEGILKENLEFVGQHMLHNNLCGHVHQTKKEFKDHITPEYFGNFFNNSDYQVPLAHECEMFLLSHWKTVQEGSS